MEKPAQFCENCGSPLGEGDSFCEACGQPVKNAADVSQAPQPSPQAPAAPEPVAARPLTPPPADLPRAVPPAVGAYPPPPPPYYQPSPPPPAYYQPPPPPAYYPPAPVPVRRRGPSTWLIVGGVILALLVCCGLAAVAVSLAGGASFLSQVSSLPESLPPDIIAENPLPADNPGPVTQATDAPDMLAEPTLTSEPAPNEPLATPALPAPQGQRMEFTDDLSTNDNGWTSFGNETPPRRGYLISAYFIETTKQLGEYRAFIPRIDNDEYKVRDFEIEFYGLLFSGDGYLGLDFHWVDDQNYYQAAVKDGKFLIRKKINGQFINLTQGPWIRSNSIWETGPNKIKVICHGDVIALEINDGLMAQLRDNSLPEGDVVLVSGVLPEAPDGTTAEARFNNFNVVWWK